MKFQAEPREKVSCAYADCTNWATIRKSLKGSSYTDLCIEHYDLQHLEEAQKWNHDNGLDTIQKRKDFIFKNNFVFKPMP